MPKGVPHINQSDPRVIRQHDEAFQSALARSTGWGFYWNGRPCTVGVSTSPSTKHPIRADVPPALSLGGGLEPGVGRGRPRKSPGWLGSADDDYEAPSEQ